MVAGKEIALWKERILMGKYTQTESSQDLLPWQYAKGLEISESHEKWHPRNCPVIERTGDGVSVGACEFYLNENTTCPRHGKIRTR
jgi:hypothetical protein